MTVEFFVAGTPMPKGSKTAIVRNGRAVLLDARRDKSRAAYAAWTAAVYAAAVDAMGEWEPIGGPIALTASFFLARPKYETRAQRLRQWHTTRPDVDKLVRAVLDPLTGVAIVDDSRIAHVRATKRLVPYEDDVTGARITLTTLSEGD